MIYIYISQIKSLYAAMMWSHEVPTSFNEMFLFNASVMGFSESKWMKQVLEHWDAIATHVANSSRLQAYEDVVDLF